MPLSNRLYLVFSHAEGPLPVILTLDTGEDFHCLITPSYTEGVFHVTLDPRYPKLPRVIIQCEYRPSSMVTVCSNPGGHLYLEVGQLVDVTFSFIEGDKPKSITLDTGTLANFTIPDLI